MEVCAFGPPECVRSAELRDCYFAEKLSFYIKRRALASLIVFSLNYGVSSSLHCAVSFGFTSFLYIEQREASLAVLEEVIERFSLLQLLCEVSSTVWTCSCFTFGILTLHPRFLTTLH